MINRPVILRHAVKVTLAGMSTFSVGLPCQVTVASQQIAIVSSECFRLFPFSLVATDGDLGLPTKAIGFNEKFVYTANLPILEQTHSLAQIKQDNAPSVTLWLAVSLGLASLSIIVLMCRMRHSCMYQRYILQENEKRYRELAHLGADLFWELDENLKFSHLSGKFHYLDHHEVKGKIAYQALASVPNLEADWISLQDLLTKQQPLENFILRLHTSSATLRMFKLNAHPLFDDYHRFQGYRGLQREITEEYNLTQTIAYQATYDPLTGLINRNEFDTRLRQAVQRVRDRNIPSVLGYLDLDQFKIVNDTAGHLIGDQLLTELANLLQRNIRSSDSLGRLGGDEFGLLLEGCSLEQGQKLSQILVDQIKDYQFTWRGRQFQVGVSIGLVPILGNTSTVVELLSRADLACYRAKDLGRGRVYLADKNDLELEQQHHDLMHIANIPQAIDENRFHLMAQPIVSLFGDTHKHVEILLRLTDEYGKTVSPGVFIPMAERYGMIGLIDRWVVKTVLNNYHHYYPEAETIVAINLSGSSLSDERFTEFVLKILEKSSMPADCLCFEITETTTISQLDQALKFITTLKKLGVSFALDDFGSGVSSFGYLRNLPVDYLKIDGDLIRNIHEEEYIRTIVDMVNQVATMMGMKTIAEFVENDAILNQLQTLNVPYGQGYSIGKPQPLPSINIE